MRDSSLFDETVKDTLSSDVLNNHMVIEWMEMQIWVLLLKKYGTKLETSKGYTNLEYF